MEGEGMRRRAAPESSAVGSAADSVAVPNDANLSLSDRGVQRQKSAEEIDSQPQSEDDDALLTDARMEKMSRFLPKSTGELPACIKYLLSGFSERWRNWIIRGFFGWVMVFLFAIFIYKGPLYLMFLVFLIQIVCFHEIISIGYAIYRMHNLPRFRLLSWWFLATSDYFLFSESLLDYFRIVLRKEETYLSFLVTYKRFVAFWLYCIGFVVFVLSLKKKYYLRQFSLFAWTHVTLVIVVSQSFLMVQNIFQGIIWFLAPVSMIICNDVMAYMFGFFFGRTPLIKLSPKKTWEGFLGGALSTVIFGAILTYFMLHYPWFVCPIEYVEDGDFTQDCVIPSSFRLHNVTLLARLFRKPPTLQFYPIIFHMLIMALFASIIGPFGGFFASGFKRAFKIKDFGDVIPGHGGLMDRFDCQLLMGTFVNVYLTSFIKVPSPAKLVQQILMLKPDSQLHVFELLRQKLNESGLLSADAF